MKLKPEQLERFAVLLLKNYRDKDVITLKADEGALKKAIVEIITNNFAEEDAIEEEARSMRRSIPGSKKAPSLHRLCRN